MVRTALILVLALAGCSRGAEPTSQAWSSGRDGLCLVGEGEALRAGLIAYGTGNSNCSLAGAAVRNGDTLTITPRGEGECRVEVRLKGSSAVVGRRSPACAYYCGPGADYSGRTLQRSEAGVRTIADLAGDPLC